MSTQGKSLTMQLVFNKTKSDNLNNIKNLNLWGNELDDLSLVEKMPNLQVISLSVNKISSLKYFSKCNKLHQLYLRKNCIEDLKEIKYLLNLPYLRSLWLYDNPCAQQQNYREIVIHHLPNLTKLDNNIVTQEEKNAANDSKYQLNFKSNQEENPRSSSHITQKNQHKNNEEKRSSKYEPKQQKVEESNWRNNKQISKHHIQTNEQNFSRNKNILMAIMSLMKQLDVSSLEIVRKQAERSIKNK